MKTFTCWNDDPSDTDEIRSFDHEDAASAYADYCWNQRDGWEWLKDGTEVYVSDGEETRKYTIMIEMEPVFRANWDDDWEPTASQEAA